jgi:hypothetical protein
MRGSGKTLDSWHWWFFLLYVCCWILVCIVCFCTSYIVSNHILDTNHCRQIEGRCQLYPRCLSNFWVSWRPRRVVLRRFYTVLGVFVWLSSAHERCWINYWAQDGMWWQMALCCSRFFFILDEVFSVNTYCFVKTMVNAHILVPQAVFWWFVRWSRCVWFGELGCTEYFYCNA